MRTSLLSIVAICFLASAANAQQHCYPDPGLPKTSMFCELYSPVVWSGPGKAFSPYYAIASTSQGDEWVLDTAAFWLRGPHPCSGTESSPHRLGDPAKGRPGGVGTFSDCYEEFRDKQTVTWRYSIQGDDSVITGVMVTIPGIPPVKVERNATVPGQALLVVHYVRRTPASAAVSQPQPKK